ncbi:MAG: helix-turn-helix domain-containing protein [Bacteroidales bacterium]|nr:helix-turn-helix domain-containing protein [Bacteroidales bacterium]
MIERIKQLIEASGLSVRAFAVKIGLNQPTLDRMIKGINAINVNCLNSILAAFPDVSAEWLMRGEGEMYKVDPRTSNYERLDKLVDTISTLQSVINDKSETIAQLNQHIKQLENKTK